MLQIPFFKEILATIAVILAIYLAFRLGKKIAVLVLNSFFGLVALLLLNFFPFTSIEINLWSILVAGFGGLIGVLLLAILSYLSIAF